MKRVSPIPRLSPNALAVLERRYLRKDAAGRPVETPTALFRRVARNVAEAERLYGSARTVEAFARRYLTMMASLDFLPNSPTLMNAGRHLQQLSACFVLPIEDSLDSIFDAVKSQALIHQSGGGTGFSFSRLRPKHDAVHSTGGLASGPISFMRVFNMATEVVKQGGTRRGANMGILRVDHPDILEFIAVKNDPAELTNFNLSVGITDAFMDALERDKPFPLRHPSTGKVITRLPATSIFHRLVESAWRTGEPGVVFLDTINEANPTPHLGAMESTNPCGEQPLLPYESCNLGSINLAHFVGTDRGKPVIDAKRLAQTVRLAVRFLDDVIDVTRFPLSPIETMTKGNRKIGLGVMGFADLLIALEVPYDSSEALTIGEDLMRLVWETGCAASEELARARGAFLNFKGSRLENAGRQQRNATVTTVAPTGTISIIAECSPGIEPLYGVRIVRNVMDEPHLVTVHPAFIRLAKKVGIYSSRLIREVAAQESIQTLPSIPEAIRRLFVTAHDVSPEQHVRMQAAFQRYSDSGVSKTINLPSSASMADVSTVFRLAHQLRCKGITVFRNGSRANQVLSCTSVEYC